MPEHLRPTFRVVDDDRRRAGPRQGPRGAQGAAAAAASPQAMAEVAADSGHRRAPARRRGRSAPSRSRSPGPGPATRCAASRRWSTRARPSGCRSSAPRTRREARHRLGVRRLLLLELAVAGRPAILGRPDQRREARRSPGRRTPSVAELLDDCRAAVRAAGRRRAAAGARRGGVRRPARPRSARTTRRSCASVLARRDPGARRLAARREGAQRPGRHGDAAGADRHEGAARPARAPRLRRRGRRRPAAPLPALPRRPRAPPRAARRTRSPATGS